MAEHLTYVQQIDVLGGGVGIFATYNKYNYFNPITTKIIGIAYNYKLNINDKLIFRGGLKISYNTNEMDISEMITVPYGEDFYTSNHLDIGLGGLLYSNQFYAAVGVSHLFEPLVDFRDGYIDNYRKYTGQFGYF